MSLSNSTWLVYNALWTILEASSSFTTAVHADNRIKYTDTSDREPDRHTSTYKDFPAVRIRPLGLGPHAHRTSNSSMKSLRWAIDVFSGEQRLAEDVDAIADVDDAIYNAMVNWKTTMSTFTHAAHGFVVPWCGMLEAETGLTQDEYQTTQRGWKTVWIGETDVWFQTTSLS